MNTKQRLQRSYFGLLFIAFQLLMCTVQAVNAQGIGNSDNDTKYIGKNDKPLVEKNIFLQRYKDSIDDAKNRKNLDKGYLSTGALSQIFSSFLPFSREKSRKVNENSQEKLSERKKSTLTQELPLYEQQILMHTDPMRKMLSESMDGVPFSFMATLHQVEPAIASAVQSTATTAALMQANKYNSQIAQWTKFTSDPDMYKQSIASYQNCMYTKTKKFQFDTVKASQVCSGDAIMTANDFEGKFDKAEAEEDTTFQGRDHPDKTRNGNRGTDDKVKVSDLIFAALLEDPNALNGNSGENVQQFVDAWKAWYGDYVVEVKVTEGQNKVFPVREGIKTKIYPSLNADENYRKLSDANFANLMDMLKAYCEEYSREQGTPNKSWFVEQADPELVRALSTHGVKFNEVVLSALFEPYFKEFKEPISSQNKYRINCDPFEQNKNGISSSVQKDQILPYYFAGYRNYANNLAYIDMLGTWLQSENFIKERTHGLGFNDEVREYALKLIYDVANTNDIAGQLANARQSLIDSLTTFSVNMARLTGRGLTGLKQDAGARTSSD